MLETLALKLLLRTSTNPCETSTVQLGEELVISQQSVSRVLAELVQEGLILKRMRLHGLELTLTEKGHATLVVLHEQIGAALGFASAKHLVGTIETGLGEGKYYLSLEGYKRPLMKLLDDEPFSGTLNLLVDDEQKMRFLSAINKSIIPGWSTNARTYGPVEFYPVKIGQIKCGLIMPVRTTHGPGKVEIVSTKNLRLLFKARDGDSLVIESREDP